MPDCFMEKRTPFKKRFQCYESETMWEDIRGYIGYAKILDFTLETMKSNLHFRNFILRCG